MLLKSIKSAVLCYRLPNDRYLQTTQKKTRVPKGVQHYQSLAIATKNGNWFYFDILSQRIPRSLRPHRPNHDRFLKQVQYVIGGLSDKAT